MCTKVRIHWTCLACRNRHLPAPLRSISLKLSPLWKYVGSKSCFAEVSCRSCKESSLKSHALHSIFQPHPGEADPHKVARVAQDSTRTYRTSTGIVERSQLCITAFQFRACKAAARLPLMRSHKIHVITVLKQLKCTRLLHTLFPCFVLHLHAAPPAGFCSVKIDAMTICATWPCTRVRTGH